jgi:hypothetical protein
VWRQFFATGKDEPWTTPPKLDKVAEAAATAFGVSQPVNQPLQFEKSLLKVSIDADAKKKADKKAANDRESLEALRTLVNQLQSTSTDVFPAGKNDPLPRLKKEIAKVKKSKKASDSLKDLAEKLEPLATSDEGASSRKQEMIALLDAVDGTGGNDSQDQPAGALQ